MDSNRERSLRRPNQTARSKHRQSISLSIRTANHVTPPAIRQATPPSQPYPIYPLPIPKEKEERALELYIQYCDAQLKEKVENSQIEPQSTASHRGGYHLAVPGPSTAHSVASSSKYSRTTSAYDAITDLSSVVSFDDEDEPTSAAVKMEGELMSYNGKIIRTRRRKKLSPVARAKAALVRYLGSCWVCRSRREKCPLEHHDIDVLERLRQRRFETPRLKVEHNSGSSISSSSQQTATSIHAWPATEPSFSQTDTLMGIGGGIGGDLNATLGTLDTSQLDIQSPGGAAYGDINLDIPDPASRPHSVSFASNLPDFGPSPYTTYQDGQMLGIGVQRNGYFCCQHLDGICLDYFPTDEELLTHFEIAHFSFTRIAPAHRFVCLTCTHLNNDLIGPCSNCQSVGTIELWIYGNYIRSPSFQRPAPDSLQDIDIANWTPTTLFSETYTTSNLEGWERDGGGGFGNGGGYTDTKGARDYGYDSQGGGGNVNFGPGSQYEYQPSNHSSYSTNRY
ncbi:hypothetical protein BKA64DRAFT_115298 [Cadophora sp. MPI-SDFR-AT-0126]|nr:hypothetical protein BKA64DRAFT_115298 [Leotiomycetes sp. MPI-SDFR-AT-0126]